MMQENDFQNEQFTTAGDIDFLFDFSPITGEAHIRFNASDDPDGTCGQTSRGVDLEQLFARYSVLMMFSIFLSVVN